MNSVNIWINNLTDLANSEAPDGMFGVGNAHWELITGDYVFIAEGQEAVELYNSLEGSHQVFYLE